jgi:hypothetical protein
MGVMRWLESAKGKQKEDQGNNQGEAGRVKRRGVKK